MQFYTAGSLKLVERRDKSINVSGDYVKINLYRFAAVILSLALILVAIFDLRTPPRVCIMHRPYSLQL